MVELGSGYSPHLCESHCESRSSWSMAFENVFTKTKLKKCTKNLKYCKILENNVFFFF